MANSVPPVVSACCIRPVTSSKSVLRGQGQGPTPSWFLVANSVAHVVSACCIRPVANHLNSISSQCLVVKLSENPILFQLKSVTSYKSLLGGPRSVTKHFDSTSSQCSLSKVSDQLQVSASWPRSVTNSKSVVSAKIRVNTPTCAL